MPATIRQILKSKVHLMTGNESYRIFHGKTVEPILGELIFGKFCPTIEAKKWCAACLQP